MSLAGDDDSDVSLDALLEELADLQRDEDEDMPESASGTDTHPPAQQGDGDDPEAADARDSQPVLRPRHHLVSYSAAVSLLELLKRTSLKRMSETGTPLRRPDGAGPEEHTVSSSHRTDDADAAKSVIVEVLQRGSGGGSSERKRRQRELRRKKESEKKLRLTSSTSADERPLRLFTTLNTREIVTAERLKKEITKYVTGGHHSRVNVEDVAEFCGGLDVGLVEGLSTEIEVESIVSRRQSRREPILRLRDGSLMSTYVTLFFDRLTGPNRAYLEDIADEIREILQETGFADVRDLALNRYDLSLQSFEKLILPKLFPREVEEEEGEEGGVRKKSIRMKKKQKIHRVDSSLFTEKHIRRQRCILRGAFTALTAPTHIEDLFARISSSSSSKTASKPHAAASSHSSVGALSIGTVLARKIVTELLSSGAVRGKIIGHDLFVPWLYEDGRRRSVLEYLRANGWVSLRYLSEHVVPGFRAQHMLSRYLKTDLIRASVLRLSAPGGRRKSKQQQRRRDDRDDGMEEERVVFFRKCLVDYPSFFDLVFARCFGELSAGRGVDLSAAFPRFFKLLTERELDELFSHPVLSGGGSKDFGDSDAPLESSFEKAAVLPAFVRTGKKMIVLLPLVTMEGETCAIVKSLTDALRLAATRRSSRRRKKRSVLPAKQLREAAEKEFGMELDNEAFGKVKEIVLPTIREVLQRMQKEEGERRAIEEKKKAEEEEEGEVASSSSSVPPAAAAASARKESIRSVRSVEEELSSAYEHLSLFSKSLPSLPAGEFEINVLLNTFLRKTLVRDVLKAFLRLKVMEHGDNDSDLAADVRRIEGLRGITDVPEMLKSFRTLCVDLRVYLKPFNRKRARDVGRETREGWKEVLTIPSTKPDVAFVRLLQGLAEKKKRVFLSFDGPHVGQLIDFFFRFGVFRGCDELGEQVRECQRAVVQWLLSTKKEQSSSGHQDEAEREEEEEEGMSLEEVAWESLKKLRVAVWPVRQK